MSDQDSPALIDAIKRLRGDEYDETMSVWFNIGSLEIEIAHLKAMLKLLKSLKETK